MSVREGVLCDCCCIYNLHICVACTRCQSRSWASGKTPVGWNVGSLQAPLAVHWPYGGPLLDDVLELCSLHIVGGLLLLLARVRSSTLRTGHPVPLLRACDPSIHAWGTYVRIHCVLSFEALHTDRAVHPDTWALVASLVAR